MLRYRANVTVRRPAHTFRPQAPPRPRGFANKPQSAASTTLGDIGRNANELNGLEARARTELSERQRQKLQKKAEKMARDIEDVAMTKERETADDMTDRGDLSGMRIGDAVVGGPIATGIDSKLAKKKAEMKSTGDAAAAAEAYAKFDEAERQFYEALPQEGARRDERRAASASPSRGDTTNTPSQSERVPGNFEGDMAPIEGMHDEAEELAGRRGPYLRPGTPEERQPEGKRRKQQQGAAQAGEQRTKSAQSTSASNERSTVLREEARLADQAEQETREEASVFQSAAASAAEQIRREASTLRETVMPKVAAGASLLKEKFQEEVLPKAMDAAAKLKEKFREEIAPKAKEAADKLKHKVTDEWAPKAAEKTKEAADKLKHKVTDEWAPKAAEKTKEAAQELRHKVADEWAPKAAEKTKETAQELRHKVADEWAPKAGEATKEAAAELKHKVADEWAPKAAEKTKEAASRLGERVKGSAPHVTEMLEESAAAAKRKVSDAAAKLMGEAPSVGDKLREGAAYAKDKAKQATEKVKEEAERLSEEASESTYLGKSSWNSFGRAAEQVKEKAEEVTDKVKDAAASARESVDKGSLRESAAHLKDQAASAMHTAGAKVRSAVTAAEEKFEGMRDRPSAAASGEGVLSNAAHRVTEAVDATGARVMEKAKEVGGNLAHKAADAAHTVRMAAEEKLKEAAHRVADKTAEAAAKAKGVAVETKARPEEWIGKEKFDEVRRAAPAIGTGADTEPQRSEAKSGSMADAVKEKVRAGVHQAAQKVEETLAAKSADRPASFDLRAENQRIEETAADALQREAGEAQARVSQQRAGEARGDQYKTPTERVALETDKEAKAPFSEKFRVRSGKQDPIVRAMQDKAEHEAEVDLDQQHKREGYRHATGHAHQQLKRKHQQQGRRHEARA